MLKVNQEYYFDVWDYESPYSITIRLIGNERLVEIDEKLIQLMRRHRPVSNFAINSKEMVVAILPRWDKFFRARILTEKKQSNLVRVHAIDYGYEEELPRNCIFPLRDDELRQIEPVHPIRVGVYGVECIRSDECDKKMKISSSIFLSYSPINIFRCLHVESDRFCGEIISMTSNQCYSNMLVDLKYAKRSEVVLIDKENEYNVSVDEGIVSGGSDTNESYHVLVDDVADDDSSGEETVCNSEDDEENDIASCSDISRRGVFNFEKGSNSTGSVQSLATLAGGIEYNNLMRMNFKNIDPLHTLPLSETHTVCVGAEASECDLPNFYKNFSPQIANQLRLGPPNNRLQKVAWPHLMNGKSAIVIDPSEHLADLLYLPVVCTHLNSTPNDRERIGPMVIIICKTQKRSDEIRRRCVQFLNGGHARMKDVVCTAENDPKLVQSKYKKCLILISSVFYLKRVQSLFKNFNFLRECNAAHHIIFDGMDSVDYSLFGEILDTAQPQQVIMTSKSWRPVHQMIISNRKSKDFVIFGGPLDIAIVANTKFNPMIVDRKTIDSTPAYRFFRILQQTDITPKTNVLIVCQTKMECDELRQILTGIQHPIHRFDPNRPEGIMPWNASLSSPFTQSDAECYCFERNGRKVYFTALPMKMNLDGFNHFIIYKSFSQVTTLPEMRHLAGVFATRLKSNNRELSSPTTISFFCYDDNESDSRELAKSFMTYQRYMHCPAYWAHVTAKDVLLPEYQLCVNFDKYHDPNHMSVCKLLHNVSRNGINAEKSKCTAIAFQILHIYSPLHYKVEIFAELRNANDNNFVYLHSKSRIVDVYVTDISKADNKVGELEQVFGQIFDDLNDRDDRFERFRAEVVMRTRNISFVKSVQLWFVIGKTHQRYPSNKKDGFVNNLVVKSNYKRDPNSPVIRCINAQNSAATEVAENGTK